VAGRVCEAISDDLTVAEALTEGDVVVDDDYTDYKWRYYVPYTFAGGKKA